MISLRLAKEDDFDQLRRFRARIFAGELGVQEERYQDVFNDYLSKNILLLRSGELIGAVRVAFSRETQEFYISYLALEPSWRRYFHLRLLLGAVFQVMKVNGIAGMRADSQEHNLPMYLSSGCRAIGPPYRKYGFRCEWTPLCYVLGTNEESEERLAAHARKWLASRDLVWRFQPRLLLCETPERYGLEVDRLIESRQIFDTVPHMGTAAECADLLSSRWLEMRTVCGPAVNPSLGGAEFSFELFNRSCNSNHKILVRRDSPCRDVAKAYAILSGKSVCAVDAWSDAELARFENAGSVLIILDAEEFTAAQSIISRRFARVSYGVATGPNPETVSWLLLKNYFRFLGPALPDEAAERWSGASGRSGARVVAVSAEDSTPDVLWQCLSGRPSHIVVQPSASHDAFLFLSCLLQAGYPFGEAVRYLNRAFPSGAAWLIGDPTLRLAPFRPVDVEADAAPVKDRPRVTLRSPVVVESLRGAKNPW